MTRLVSIAHRIRRAPPSLLSALPIGTVFLFMASAFCRADEPSLTVYEVLHENINTAELPAVILKINNPPGRKFYIYGLYMTDVPHVLEVEQNGHWTPLPPFYEPLAVRKMRAFLPGSYLLFDVYPPSTSYPYEDNLKFRVRAFLYTNPAFTNPFLDLRQRPFIEVISRPIFTQETAPLKTPAPPSIPGLVPVPAGK